MLFRSTSYLLIYCFCIFLISCELKDVDPTVLKTIESLKAEGLAYYKEKEYDQAENSFKQMILLTEEYDLKLLNAKGLNNLASVNKRNEKEKEAIENYHKAINIYLKLKEEVLVAETSYFLGDLYRNLDDKRGASKSYERAVEIFEKVNHKYLTRCYLRLGLTFKDLAKYDKSLQYYSKYKERRAAEGDQKGVAIALHNMGTAYLKLSQKDQAIQQFEKSLLIKHKLGNKKLLATTYERLGEFYFNENKLENSEKNYLKVFELREEIAPNPYLLDNCRQLGEVYYRMGKLEKAKEYLLRGVKVQETQENVGLFQESYWLLFQIVWDEKHYQQGYKYKDIAKDYEYRKKEIDELKNKIAANSAIIEDKHTNELYKGRELEKRDRKVLIWVGLVFIILSALILFFALKNKKSVSRLSEEQSRMRTQMSEIRGLLTYSADNKGKKTNHREVDSRMLAMMYVHELRNKNPGKPIELSSYLDGLVNNMRFIYGYANSRLQINLDIDRACLVNERNAIRIGIIVNEIFSDILQYGFQEVEKPEFSIDANQKENKLIINIHANGEAFKNGFNDILSDMVHELKTNLEIEQEKGFTCYFEVIL